VKVKDVPNEENSPHLLTYVSLKAKVVVEGGVSRTNDL
jgi:hypothetical protein